MLRIKESTTEEELKKLGYIRCPDFRWEDYVFVGDDEEFEFIFGDCERFYIKDNYIIAEHDWFGDDIDFLLDRIYDLIQAGLIEKVGGKDE